MFLKIEGAKVKRIFDFTKIFLGGGFTAYNKNIALSLQSVYAKRMYELCCRWKDKGFLRISIDEFRHMFCIEDKFNKISELRVNVLDLAQKMLTEYADLTFRYELKKENNSRSFNWLNIWITTDNQDTKDKATQKAYETVYNFLYDLFRNSRAMEITDYIADNKELKRAAERIIRLRGDINSGRIKVHGREQYIRKVIQDEFHVPAEMMGESKAKKKQREVGEAIFKKAIAKKEFEEKNKIDYVQKAKEAMKKQAFVNLFNSEDMRGGGKTLGALLRGDKKG